MILYHGTNPTFGKSIMENGFLDRVGSRKSNWSKDIQSKEGFVYLTSAYAFYYAVACSKGKKGAIIQVDIKEEDLYPDEDFIMQANKLSKKETALIDLEDYKHISMLSLNHLGTVCAKPDKITVTGYREFDINEIIRYSDPIITLMNYRILGGYYKRLTTTWFETGKFIQ